MLSFLLAPRGVIWGAVAAVVGFFGGGYLHYFGMRLLAEDTDLHLYSWNDPAQGTVLRSVLLADFVIGALLATVAALLIIWRGSNVWRWLVLGFGASVVAYEVMGVVLCMVGC